MPLATPLINFGSQYCFRMKVLVRETSSEEERHGTEKGSMFSNMANELTYLVHLNFEQQQEPDHAPVLSFRGVHQQHT